ncbi:MAG: HAD family hydrolase [Sphingomonadaceae bacterium]
MTINTVFLDLYHTLVYFHPEREQRQSEAMREFGFHVDPADLRRAYLAADHYYTLAGMETPLHLLDPAARDRVYLRYQEVVMEEVGLGHAIHLAEEIRRRYWEQPRELRLFPDVEAALANLKSSGYRLGLITNVTDDPTADLERTGLRNWFDVVVASCLVGIDKPDPRIFHFAMERLGVAPEEGIHVGDQFLADVEGASSAGLEAVLLDRYDLQEGRHPLRIRSLLDLAPLLRNRNHEGV